MYYTEKGTQPRLDTVCHSNSHSGLSITQALETPVTLDVAIVVFTFTRVS